MLHAESGGRKPAENEPSFPPKIEDVYSLQIKVSPTENNTLNFVSMEALYLQIETI